MSGKACSVILVCSLLLLLCHQPASTTSHNGWWLEHYSMEHRHKTSSILLFPSFFQATVSSLLGRKPFIEYELPCQVSHALGNEMSLSLLLPIDGEGLFGIWPAAGADNASEF